MIKKVLKGNLVEKTAPVYRSKIRTFEQNVNNSIEEDAVPNIKLIIIETLLIF